MKEDLGLPRQLDGRAFYHRYTGRRHYSHRHAELEVNLALTGTATYMIDGRRFDLEPGTLLWLFPRQDHFLLNQSPEFTMWVAIWRSRLIRRACTTESTRVLCAQRPAFDFCKRIGQARVSRLELLFREASVAEKAGDAGRTNVLLAYSLLAAWDAHAAQEEITPGLDLHPAVERAARLLRDEGESMGTGELSRRAGLSAARLNRLFRRQTGVSLVAYRNRLRMSRFMDLYAGGARPKMLAAALEAGFGSYAQFHRVFRRMMGCGPRQYDFGGM
jgi:AraC-like DNA-binding protein